MKGSHELTDRRPYSGHEVQKGDGFLQLLSDGFLHSVRIQKPSVAPSDLLGDIWGEYFNRYIPGICAASRI